MSEISTAWMLQIGGGMQVAVAENEMIEYLISPRTHRVPMAPPICASVIFWRDGSMLPVFDLAALAAGSLDTGIVRLGVLAYQTSPGTPLRHAAIRLAEQPRKILVSDDDACGWPDGLPRPWRALTLALFEHQGFATPVLDIAGLCTGRALAMGDRD